MSDDPGSRPAPETDDVEAVVDDFVDEPIETGEWTAEEVASDVAAADEPVPDEPVVPEPSSWLPLLDHRSSDPTICPFLRSVEEDGALGVPIEAPVAENRCAALREAVPQSLRQQELVCLTGGHVNCPRYLRGALVVSEQPRLARISGGASLTPATIGALAVLAASFVLSVSFMLARGGLSLPQVAAIPSVGPSGSAVAIASATPPSTQVPSAASPTATPPPSPTPAPTPTAIASPTPTPAPTPTASPTPAATPQSSSDRYELLDPCPDRPDCWMYTIRSGDNLVSIANYFGVPLAEVRSLNPWTRTEGLRAGQELILPPPTR